MAIQKPEVQPRNPSKNLPPNSIGYIPEGDEMYATFAFDNETYARRPQWLHLDDISDDFHAVDTDALGNTKTWNIREWKFDGAMRAMKIEMLKAKDDRRNNRVVYTIKIEPTFKEHVETVLKFVGLMDFVNWVKSIKIVIK